MRTAFLITALFFLSCNNNTKQEVENKDTATVTIGKAPAPATTPESDPIIDSLMKLPFISKSNNYIDSFSNHQQGISFLSDTTGTEISVRAGYNGPERFETYYIFTIDRKTGEIKIMDPVEGDYIPLKVYLENNQ